MSHYKIISPKKTPLLMASIVLTTVTAANHAIAQESHAEIAKKLNNPIAAMISVPFQYNNDRDIGPGDKGERQVLNIQPVIPISISEDWNIISRTILPLVDQKDLPPGQSENGIGDVTQSLFFSPKATTDSGWTWGVGPVLLLATASDDTLGTEKWAAGPTAVFLKQENGWTYGALVNHLWDFAGDNDRADVNATFMQPFLAYTTAKFTTFTLNTEASYNWEQDEASVPLNMMATQLFKVKNHPMSLQLGLRYWAETTDTSPEGWGLRITYTLVLPK